MAEKQKIPLLYCFLDTNILMEFQTFDEVEWTRLLNAKRVYLVLAPVVLEELDKHKIDYNHPRRQKRVRMLLSKLNRLIESEETADDLSPVRSDVMLLVLSHEPSIDWTKEHLDPTISDDRLLASMLHFSRQHTNEYILLLSDDFGPRRKAKSHNIQASKTPEGLKRLADPLPLEEPQIRQWNIPYAPNPFFTGREDLLESLHTQFQTTQAVAVSQPQAISGLGGIGKTQLAIEYAHRYRQEYQAVLWAQADTTETLNVSYTEIAKLLQLPQQNAQEQEVIVQVVKGWLRSKGGWLLILDNADDLDMVQEFLPIECPGHILFTTRSQIMGKLARRLDVETLDVEMGALLLLRRARLIQLDALLDTASASDRSIAYTLTEELGGLPLALDQAGAYIEETQSSLADYQSYYRTRRTELLKKRGGLIGDHPKPVATTWSLSFEKIEQEDPAAANLLRFCAFLQPDAIPEEIITIGAEHLGVPLRTFADPLALNDTITALSKYSLIKRDSNEKLLSIHRLVQAIIKDEMNGETQWQWEERAVRAVNLSFPYDEEAPWTFSQRYIAHAFACIDLFNSQKKNFPELTELLHKVGVYLLNREQFEEAKSYLHRALEIREQVLGANHPDVAQTLNHLGILYGDQGNYEQAEFFYKRALKIREQVLGANHPDTATSLNNLARRYRDQGKHKLAESYFLRALAIKEQVQGANHPHVANICNNLAQLYYKQGQYDKAETLFERALTIREKEYGADHPYTAQTLKGLANLYRDQGNYELAESFYQRTLAITEQNAGKNHSDTAVILNSWATLYRDQGNYEQAEPLYQRALAIQEQALGADHPRLAQVLNNLATCYYKQDNDAQAEPLYLRALRLREHAKIVDNYTITTLINLTTLYRKQSKYEQAESVCLSTLRVFEQSLGSDHPSTQTVRRQYASLKQAVEDNKKTGD